MDLCHFQNYIESVSVEISSVMTRLGYGEKIRRWRVETNREYSRLTNGTLSFVTMITTGSKAEGLTCCFESDWDFLRVLNDFLCVETGINLHNIPDDIEVYRMDTYVYSGYCRLFLERQAPRYSKIIHNALCDNGDGDVLLSSGLFLDEIWTLPIRSSQNLDGLVVHERAGPSIPQSVHGVFHMDFVIALPCHCPSILQRWATRPRHWPSPAIVQKVVSLGTYLTPVGFKGSKYRNMEWRICFNTGEAELVNNLNETQAKVYVMLKMILKDILKPCNKEITPFVLKNIILWQAENNPQTNFHARSLLQWLHDGLRELRTAIEKKQLRYFMIPERNLMAACGLEDALQH
ncbi:hypothetical protein DPMN_192593 [Dreissena polymorpha]|uniref:Mab-21-like nucleotidyltransferase domain-containing protein n=1 Tax=Dreissena polymorpha TaxID=45954 RepID=A0A9D3Y5Y7_DREPO|nr:hypothetical protein DPMN_192593 [Dreissena polymorpha]